MSARKWFHPHLSGQEAERLLKEGGLDGTYLVRPSKSNPGDYTLSVRRGAEVTHIKIQNTGDFYDLYGGEKFATLSELVQYYTEHDGQLKEKEGEVIVLKQPMLCEDPTTERWFHGHVSGKDAEAMLLAQGLDGSFLVRASQRQPGDFVLSVRVKERVSHVMISNVGGRYAFPGGETFPDLSSLVEHVRKHPLVETTGDIVSLRQPLNATKVGVANLSARMDALSMAGANASTGFLEEFEKLQQTEYNLKYTRLEGQRPENKAKNRYKNILPYDHTRVQLQEVGPEVGADYINASHISGITKSSENAYIACQGCLKATITSFWQMMWEQRACIISMVTNEVEGGKNKCARYFPDAAAPLAKHGKFIIEHITEQIFPHYILRRMNLSMEGKPKREISQYHYITWPDHGVPEDPTTLLTYIEKIREQIRRMRSDAINPGPLVVHCSAGIGRTGTVVVLDSLMEFVAENGLQCDIDVQGTVARIREQRSGLIQTEAQYRFIYQSMYGYVQVLAARARAQPTSAGGAAEVYENLHDVHVPAPAPLARKATTPALGSAVGKVPMPPPTAPPPLPKRS